MGAGMIWDAIKEVNGLLKDTFIIWAPVALIAYWFWFPEIRWIYPIALFALLTFTLIFCPILVLMAIAVPLMWVSDKLHKGGRK